MAPLKFAIQYKMRQVRLPYETNRSERKVFKTNQPTFNFSKLTSLIQQNSGDPNWKISPAPDALVRGDLSSFFSPCRTPLLGATPAEQLWRGRHYHGRPRVLFFRLKPQPSAPKHHKTQHFIHKHCTAEVKEKEEKRKEGKEGE